MKWFQNNILKQGLPFNCVCGTYELVVIFIYQHLQVSIEILYLSSHFDMPVKQTFQIGLLHLYVWWNMSFLFSRTRKDAWLKEQLTPWESNRLNKDLPDKYITSQIQKLLRRYTTLKPNNHVHCVKVCSSNLSRMR